MVLAEAVIARAAGAVAELQIGEIGVGASADFALVAVALLSLFALPLAGGVAEMNRFRGSLVLYALAVVDDPVRDVRPEEHEKVENRNQWEQRPD